MNATMKTLGKVLMKEMPGYTDDADEVPDNKYRLDGAHMDKVELLSVSVYIFMRICSSQGLCKLQKVDRAVVAKFSTEMVEEWNEKLSGRSVGG